jgi:predicted ATP-grasp superfamily ATP-dependent carboligase
MVKTLNDKTLFQAFAQSERFPVPSGIVLRSSSELAGIDNIPMPVVVKPGDKCVMPDQNDGQTVRAETSEAAAAAASLMFERGAITVLVQQWIDGADADILFCLFACDASSRPVAMFCGRKLVVSPPQVGSTALCVEEAHRAQELRKLTERYIAKAQYKGIGSLEVKCDRSTGNMVIIEPTVGRTDWQEEIATLSGVNIPLLTYKSELGAPWDSKPYAPQQPVAWRGSVGFRSPPGALVPGTRIFDGPFRLADPLPGFYFYLIHRFFGRIWRFGKRVCRQRGFTNAPAIQRPEPGATDT